MLKITETTDFSAGQYILVDKPYRWTSFDLVKKIMLALRKTYRLNKLKVGHTGTLDPLATGLMLICTGRFTKDAESLQTADKEYLATFALGKTTPSFDLETEVDQTYPTEHITQHLVVEALKTFIGEIEQIPPIFSAKSINGKRAYEYARKGQELELKPNKIFIKEIELLEFLNDSIKIRIVCSKGTYIRALARDIGKALHSGAYLSALKRTAIGEFRIEGAYALDELLNKLLKIKETLQVA
jgi:tRNA pseudouridine55 synthase